MVLLIFQQIQDPFVIVDLTKGYTLFVLLRYSVWHSTPGVERHYLPEFSIEDGDILDLRHKALRFRERAKEFLGSK